MPAKNVLKEYAENGFYHVYNRGVEKRIIFCDDQDYKVFLGDLKAYLEPPPPLEKRITTIGGCTFSAIKRPLNNYYKEIELLSFCLIPNHFHLLIRQKSSRSIEYFMKSLLTKYVVYFNKRYQRVGTLFQGPYKAVFVNTEEYLLHLSRYIHLNPKKHLDVKDSPLHMAYSSYGDYLGLRESKWINTDFILSFFKKSCQGNSKDMLSYQSFVEDYFENSEEKLGKLIIEEDM